MIATFEHVVHTSVPLRKYESRPISINILNVVSIEPADLHMIIKEVNGEQVPPGRLTKIVFSAGNERQSITVLGSYSEVVDIIRNTKKRELLNG